MVRHSIGSHSEFLPRALNSEFPSLRANIDEEHFLLYIWKNDWKTIKDISLHTLYDVQGWGIFGKGSEKRPKHISKKNTVFFFRMWHKNWKKTTFFNFLGISYGLKVLAKKWLFGV